VKSLLVTIGHYPSRRYDLAANPPPTSALAINPEGLPSASSYSVQSPYAETPRLSPQQSETLVSDRAASEPAISREYTIDLTAQSVTDTEHLAVQTPANLVTSNAQALTPAPSPIIAQHHIASAASSSYSVSINNPIAATCTSTASPGLNGSSESNTAFPSILTTPIAISDNLRARLGSLRARFRSLRASPRSRRARLRSLRDPP